jgi:hypothetical protein
MLKEQEFRPMPRLRIKTRVAAAASCVNSTERRLQQGTDEVADQPAPDSSWLSSSSEPIRIPDTSRYRLLTLNFGFPPTAGRGKTPVNRLSLLELPSSCCIPLTPLVMSRAMDSCLLFFVRSPDSFNAPAT